MREILTAMSYKNESESRHKTSENVNLDGKGYRPQFLPPCKQGYG